VGEILGNYCLTSCYSSKVFVAVQHLEFTLLSQVHFVFSFKCIIIYIIVIITIITTYY